MTQIRPASPPTSAGVSLLNAQGSRTSPQTHLSFRPSHALGNHVESGRWRAIAWAGPSSSTPVSGQKMMPAHLRDPVMGPSGSVLLCTFCIAPPAPSDPLTVSRSPNTRSHSDTHCLTLSHSQHQLHTHLGTCRSSTQNILSPSIHRLSPHCCPSTAFPESLS